MKSVYFVRLSTVFLMAGALLLVSGCQAQSTSSAIVPNDKPTANKTPADTRNQSDNKAEAPNQEKTVMETATFGAGCFWCVEAVFQQLEGVEAVKSGYMGGKIKDPTYKQVCTGTTGHAEVIQVEFDPQKISFAELLEVFWKTHDPTTLNRQGNDTGTQYRSAVFYHNDEQKQLAENYKKELNEAKAFDNPIVTEIVPAAQLYVAENYHQNFFNENPGNPYCRAVIPSKLEKLKKVFADKLKQ